MNRNLLETIIGGIVLCAAGFFLYFAYSHSSIKTDDNTYSLIAKFDRVDGLLIGSEVRMSGVKVGTITSLELDPDSYLAVAKIAVRNDIKLPSDSSAEVQSDGLLGDKYMSLVPGGEETYINEGEEIINTQSAVNLTDLIGKAIFNSSKKEEEVEEATDDEENETKPSETHKANDARASNPEKSKR